MSDEQIQSTKCRVPSNKLGCCNQLPSLPELPSAHHSSLITHHSSLVTVLLEISIRDHEAAVDRRKERSRETILRAAQCALLRQNGLLFGCHQRAPRIPGPRSHLFQLLPAPQRSS